MPSISTQTTSAPGDAWSYQTYDGRRRKTVTDPFPLIAFLYPPQILAALENDLALAESLAATPKVKTRLALVRTEFEYLRHLAKVVHLYQAFVLLADAPSRDQLLNAIDARNEAIDALYKKGPRTKSAGDWAQVFFPFSGHSAEHLRLAYDAIRSRSQTPVLTGIPRACVALLCRAKNACPWRRSLRL